MPFTFRALDLPGVTLIEPKVFEDDRGFFMETYKSSDFTAAGISAPLMQENHSRSTQGTLRGMHAQREPKAQAKLVRVVEGEIYRRSGGREARIADIRPLGVRDALERQPPPVVHPGRLRARLRRRQSDGRSRLQDDGGVRAGAGVQRTLGRSAASHSVAARVGTDAVSARSALARTKRTGLNEGAAGTDQSATVAASTGRSARQA